MYTKAAAKKYISAPLSEDEVKYHYLCLVNVVNYLYVLNNDLEEPLQIGQIIDKEDVLYVTGLNIVKKFVESNKNRSFNIFALIRD